MNGHKPTTKVFNTDFTPLLGKSLKDESSMSETPAVEVDYGSTESIAHPPTDSDHAWSTSENDSQD